MLKVHTEKLGGTVILRLRGRIVTGQTAALSDAVDCQSDAGAVVLDLARVNGIDAGGLGVMLGLREQLQPKGIEFRLINVTRLVQQVLEIARLESIFEISPDAGVPPEESPDQTAAEVEIASSAWPAG